MRRDYPDVIVNGRQYVPAERVRDVLQMQQDIDLREALGMPQDAFVDFARKAHTAGQWVSHGYVPLSSARWTPSDDGVRVSYCTSAWDVRWDPEWAAYLEESGPNADGALPDGRAYDGRPWWVSETPMATEDSVLIF